MQPCRRTRHHRLTACAWARAFLYVALGVITSTGCRRDRQSAPQGNPQDRLPTVQLWIGTATLKAEVASTFHEREKGMMFRTAMGEDEGMLFVFPQAGQASFWMRNTLVPLSIAYLDAEGVILEVHDLEPLNETPVPSESAQVRFALETPRGWFQRHQAGPGTKVRSERGPLLQTVRARG